MQIGKSNFTKEQLLEFEISDLKDELMAKEVDRKMARNTSEKLHKLNRELIIEMAEKDQLIKELSKERNNLADFIIAKAIRKEWGHYESK